MLIHRGTCNTHHIVNSTVTYTKISVDWPPYGYVVALLNFVMVKTWLTQIKFLYYYSIDQSQLGACSTDISCSRMLIGVSTLTRLPDNGMIPFLNPSPTRRGFIRKYTVDVLVMFSYKLPSTRPSSRVWHVTYDGKFAWCLVAGVVIPTGARKLARGGVRCPLSMNTRHVDLNRQFRQLQVRRALHSSYGSR